MPTIKMIPIPRLSHWLAAIGLILAYSGFSAAVEELRRPSLENQFAALDGVEETGMAPFRLPVSDAVTLPQAPAIAIPQEITNLELPAGADLPDVLAEADADGETGTTLPAGGGPAGPMLYIPDWIAIPEIDLFAPVEPANVETITLMGQRFHQWVAPNQPVAGWHTDSAPLGRPGNTVLNGHHNVYGKVFGRLAELQPGAQVLVFAGNTGFVYRVTNVMILPEKYQELDLRLANALWLEPSTDERLTLVTCWPEQSNTHRLILVAVPEGQIEVRSPRIKNLPQ